MAVQIGDQLGDYRLVCELGTGAFGTVFEAHHQHIGMQVAIKVLHGQITDAERAKLRAEASRQARLDHPHILPVLGYSEQPVPYLVMKFAPNGTLKDSYRFGQCYLLATILPHIRQIAAGLQHAHDQQTLHLDLKPANILRGRQQEALISDFGIAVILAEHRTYQTLSGFAGTPAYAAPEQIQNRPGKASDQYALAIMVYQWLTGTLPFTGDLWSIGVQKLTSDPPALRSLVPDLPEAVEQVVLRALAKAPQERYGSVQEFAEALEAAARPSKAREPSKTKEDWLKEGNALFGLERYEEALAAYEQALRLDPSDADAWTGKGNALNKLKRYEEALAACEQALRLDPNSAIAWKNKGVALYGLKRYEEALAAYAQALRLDPNSALAWNNKGTVLNNLKRYQEVLAACEQALRLDPNSALAWNGKGNALFGLKRYEEALAAYEQALRLDPSDAIAWGNKALTLERLGRKQEAKQARAKARELG